MAGATVVAALPLFAARGLPVFVEDLVPGFATMDAEGQAGVANGAALATALYVFAMLWFLRAWLYKHADRLLGRA